MRKNKSRGDQKLRVWHDASDDSRLPCNLSRGFPDALKRVASQAIASSDSVHRNIAEGYCRRSIHEYLNFLTIALGSLGESVSGLYAGRNAPQIAEEAFQKLDDLAYKLENGLLKLGGSLEQKRDQGEWVDHLPASESDATSGNEEFTTPLLQYSTTPLLHHSSTPEPQCTDTHMPGVLNEIKDLEFGQTEPSSAAYAPA